MSYINKHYILDTPNKKVSSHKHLHNSLCYSAPMYKCNIHQYYKVVIILLVRPGLAGSIQSRYTQLANIYYVQSVIEVFSKSILPTFLHVRKLYNYMKHYKTEQSLSMNDTDDDGDHDDGNDDANDEDDNDDDDDEWRMNHHH